MAPPIATDNERGTALLEGLPVFAVLMILVSGVLVTSYLLFAHAWMQWQSEQALYCAAIGTNAGFCERQLKERMREFLPWGQVRALVSRRTDEWQVEVWWSDSKLSFHTRRALSPRLILANRALRW